MTNRLGMGGVTLALVTAVLYTAGMAIVMSTATHDYSQTQLLLGEVLLPLAVLVAATVVLAVLCGLRLQFTNRIGWPGWVMALLVAIAVIGGVTTLVSGGADWRTIGVVLMGTLLVGIGEETTYRGIVLNALSQRISLFWAVLASSLLFGLMHSVNVIVQAADATIVQVVVTSFVGLALGWTYVFAGGNLWLVIALHWLYDFALIAPLATAAGSNPVTFIAPVMLALGLVLTVVAIVKFRGSPWTSVQQAEGVEARATG